MRPGVTMDRPQQRRERTGIVQIMVIGAVLAAALYGGVRLLGNTHAAWDQRQAARKAYATEIRNASREARAQEESDIAEAKLLQLVEHRRNRARGLADGSLRCINGQLFKRLENGWENLPGERCQ